MSMGFDFKTDKDALAFAAAVEKKYKLHCEQRRGGLSLEVRFMPKAVSASKSSARIGTVLIVRRMSRPGRSRSRSRRWQKRSSAASSSVLEVQSGRSGVSRTRPIKANQKRRSAKCLHGNHHIADVATSQSAVDLT
jgi:hypothetical protein